MFSYIFKRLAWAIPTWLVISALIFSLSHCASSDPVGEKLRAGSESTVAERATDVQYAEMAHDLGLDKPTFYCALLPAAFPDTFYKILRRDEQNALEQLIWQYGNWSAISVFHNQTLAFLSKITYNTEGGAVFQNNVQQLLIQTKDESIVFLLQELKKAADTTSFKTDVANINEAYVHLKQNPTTRLIYIPKWHWFGFNNQYHHWLTGFLKGNWGFSKNGQSVAEQLRTPLSITFILTLFATLLAYMIGVPIGVYVAANRHKPRGQWVMRGVFTVYSLPTFWLTTLAAMFLTTHYYGLKIFPNVGFDKDMSVGATIWQTLFENSGHLILPIFCAAVHPSTIIARHIQGAVTDILKKDYIQTARAKGLPQRSVLWRHAVRNALTPLITLLGQIIPTMVGGSFAVELIFNLQGIGLTMIDALFSKDWTVVFAVVMLISVIILINNLFVDMLYYWLNPRVEL